MPTEQQTPSPDNTGSPFAFYAFIGILVVCLIVAIVYVILS